MNRVIVTGENLSFKYTYLNRDVPPLMVKYIENCLSKFDWYIGPSQNGSLVQGVLDTTDISIAVDFCKSILSKYPNFLFVISLGEIDNPEPSIGKNMSSGLIENGRALDVAKKIGDPGIRFLGINSFYVFGSKSSRDYDVLVLVDSIPKDVDRAHSICEEYNQKISSILKDKPLNSNLGIIRDGHVAQVFKGTADEVNNSLFYTYDLHGQFFPLPILSVVDRDIDQKFIRVARFIVSFYSRTHLRPVIKKALRGDFLSRIEALKQIDFKDMTEFPGKKGAKSDIYKVIAFQFGQSFSLIDGHEPDSYTKEGISKNYPSISNIINRGTISSTDLDTLNSYLLRFIGISEDRMKSMKNLDENL